MLSGIHHKENNYSFRVIQRISLLNQPKVRHGQKTRPVADVVTLQNHSISVG